MYNYFLKKQSVLWFFLNGYNGFRMVYKDYQMSKIKKS